MFPSAVIHCASLPGELLLEWNTTDTVYGTVAGALCPTGYSVTGGPTVCGTGAAWDFPIQDITCECELEIIHCFQNSYPLYIYPGIKYAFVNKFNRMTIN